MNFLETPYSIFGSSEILAVYSAAGYARGSRITHRDCCTCAVPYFPAASPCNGCVMTVSENLRLTEDGRIYRSGRKTYPNGDTYSVSLNNRGVTAAGPYHVC